MKKRALFVSIGVVIIMGLAAVLFINASNGEEKYPEGVRNVKITENNSGQRVLRIEHGGGYSENSHYSVRMMAQDDKEFYGEKLIENNGSLGKYRIEIMFGSVKASSALYKDYPSGTVHEIKDVSDVINSIYKIKIAYPPDDSMFVIYVGSDEPITVSEQKYISTKGVRGTIDIVLE